MGLGFEIRKKAFSGFWIQVQGKKGTGSRIRIRNTVNMDSYVLRSGKSEIKG
jgi:hypothetical protein